MVIKRDMIRSKYSILIRLNKKEWKMTLFAFTYANACTAMKGFDTNKNKKLEDEERSKLVYYIEVNFKVLSFMKLLVTRVSKDIKTLFRIFRKMQTLTRTSIK